MRTKLPASVTIVRRSENALDRLRHEHAAVGLTLRALVAACGSRCGSVIVAFMRARVGKSDQRGDPEAATARRDLRMSTDENCAEQKARQAGREWRMCQRCNEGRYTVLRGSACAEISFASGTSMTTGRISGSPPAFTVTIRSICPPFSRNGASRR